MIGQFKQCEPTISNSVQDKQSGAMKTQVKRIMQPGKLQNPVDVASQTEKRDPKLKVQIPKGKVKSLAKSEY